MCSAWRWDHAAGDTNLEGERASVFLSLMAACDMSLLCPQGVHDVRLAYIQFALSFLIAGDDNTIGQVLELKGGSSSLCFGKSGVQKSLLQMVSARRICSLGSCGLHCSAQRSCLGARLWAVVCWYHWLVAFEDVRVLGTAWGRWGEDAQNHDLIAWLP